MEEKYVSLHPTGQGIYAHLNHSLGYNCSHHIRLDTCRHHYRFLSSLYNRIHLYTSTIQEENSFHREGGPHLWRFWPCQGYFWSAFVSLAQWVSDRHRAQKLPAQIPNVGRFRSETRPLLIRFLVLNFTNPSWFTIDHVMCVELHGDSTFTTSD